MLVLRGVWTRLEFRAFKMMKSGFYYTDLKQKKSIKLLKVLFKYIFTTNGPRMTIIRHRAARHQWSVSNP